MIPNSNAADYGRRREGYPHPNNLLINFVWTCDDCGRVVRINWGVTDTDATPPTFCTYCGKPRR